MELKWDGWASMEQMGYCSIPTRRQQTSCQALSYFDLHTLRSGDPLRRWEMRWNWSGCCFSRSVEAGICNQDIVFGVGAFLPDRLLAKDPSITSQENLPPQVASSDLLFPVLLFSSGHLLPWKSQDLLVRDFVLQPLTGDAVDKE